MLVQERTVDDLVLLDINGRLGVESREALRDAVVEALRRGRQKLVLNLADVTMIDAAGLGEIVDAHNMVRMLGGALKLVYQDPTLHELLARTHLRDVLDTFRSEAEAKASFDPCCPHRMPAR